MRTVWRGPCGRKMTEILGTALTEIVTAETAVANPGAESVARYAPGGIPSRRNSPSGLLVAVRLSGDSSCSTVIVAPATRAPLASSAIPTSAPSAFERLELYYGLLLKLNGFARQRLFLVGLVNGVEYAVDERRRLFRRKLLGEFERLVDDYLGRRCTRAQLRDRQAQDGAVNCGHAIQAPVCGVP